MRYVYLGLALATVGAAMRWGWGPTGLAIFGAAVLAVAAIVGFLWVVETPPPSEGRQVVVGRMVDEPGMYVLGADLNENGTIDRVKLGSSGSMTTRAKQLRTSAPTPLWPVASYPTPAPEDTEEEFKRAVARKLAYALETEWHQRYDAQKIEDPYMGDEWYLVQGRLHADLLADGVVLNTMFIEYED